jgi:hypothetical protein
VARSRRRRACAAPDATPASPPPAAPRSARWPRRGLLTTRRSRSAQCLGESGPVDLSGTSGSSGRGRQRRAVRRQHPSDTPPWHSCRTPRVQVLVASATVVPLLTGGVCRERGHDHSGGSAGRMDRTCCLPPIGESMEVLLRSPHRGTRMRSRLSARSPRPARCSEKIPRPGDRDRAKRHGRRHLRTWAGTTVRGRLPDNGPLAAEGPGQPILTRAPRRKQVS